MGMLSTARVDAHLKVGMIVDPCGAEVVRMLREREPSPAWNFDDLRLRVDCYRRAGLPEAGQAMEDLRTFLAAEPTPLLTSPQPAPRGSS